jgi:hypothetical protein
MNRAAFQLWIGITWIVTLGIAYMVGWYRGAKSVATIAVSTAQSSFSYILIALAVVAAISAYAAFRARGYFDSSKRTSV